MSWISIVLQLVYWTAQQQHARLLDRGVCVCISMERNPTRSMFVYGNLFTCKWLKTVCEQCIVLSSCNTKSCKFMHCHATSCKVIQCHVNSCNVMQSHARSCKVMHSWVTHQLRQFYSPVATFRLYSGFFRRLESRPLNSHNFTVRVTIRMYFSQSHGKVVEFCNFSQSHRLVTHVKG